MFRLLVTVALLSLAFPADCDAGWFSDTDFYVVVQQSPGGKFIDGWVAQGAPKNSDGVYIFTLYQTKVEKRVPIQSAVVTRIGSDATVARRWLQVQIEDATNGFHKGF